MRSDSRGRPKLLFFTEQSPFPAAGGSRLRDYCQLKLLDELADVVLVCFKPLSGHEPEALAIEALDRQANPAWVRALSPARPYILNGYSREVEATLRAHASDRPILWLSRLVNAKYIGIAKKLGYRVVLDEHNVESALLRSLERPLPKGLYDHWLAGQCERWEGIFSSRADLVVATSELDATRLRELAPEARVEVLPNCIDIEPYLKVRQNRGRTLLFPATLSYQPNLEGIRWFVSSVLPLAQAALGDSLPRIVVAGADPDCETRQLLSNAGIELHANPVSMLPLLAEAWAVFVPLLSGSGTRLKILEALAAGRAVISTSKGAEGLTITSGRDCLLADTPADFAAAIARLVREPGLAPAIVAEGARTVEQLYDWRRHRETANRIVNERLRDA